MKAYNWFKRLFSYRKFSGLGVFLFISVAVWIVSELNATYATFVRVPIKIEQTPVDFLLQDSVYYLDAQLESSGFGFVANNLGTYSIESLTQYGITDSGRLYLSRNHFNQIKINDLPSNIEFLNWSTQDSIFLNVIPSFSKRVEVLPNLKYELKRNYRLRQIDIQPKTIDLFGELQALEDIDYVYTEELDLGEIYSDSKHNLGFGKLPQNALFSFSPDQVKVSLRVQEFTERAFTVDLKNLFVNSDSLKNQLFLPEMVTVKLKAYKNALQGISNQDITEWITPHLSSSNMNNYYSISATKLREEILDVQFEPDSIRFFERIK